MRLSKLQLSGFKSFSKKTEFLFSDSITAVVGPNGSGKSNVAEALRWVLGEQSLKSLRGRRGEDLIFNGANSTARANRAQVLIELNNHDRSLPIDFETVAISRTVHRDGVNEYAINGTAVRMREVIELLSHAAIGASGHHIISQGQADRILNAGLKERKDMVEDSLGLKIYHWKLDASEKKIAKTKENIKQVESLRRELAPHLKYLTKQVEKIKEADELRQALKKESLEYLSREDQYLSQTKAELDQKKEGPREELKKTLHELESLEVEMKDKPEQVDHQKQQILSGLDNRISQLIQQKEELSRLIGRLEGKMETQQSPVQERRVKSISWEKVESFLAEIKKTVNLIKEEKDPLRVSELLAEVEEKIMNWSADHDQKPEEEKEKTEQWNNWLIEKRTLQRKEKEKSNLIDSLRSEKDNLKRIIEKDKVNERKAERCWYELKSRQGKLDSELREIDRQLSDLERLEQEFKAQVEELAILVDLEIKNWANLCPPKPEWLNESRSQQEVRRREIEKMKLKLEQLGVGGEAVLEEYKQVKNRDEYLTQELEDLKAAENSLRKVMDELRTTLNSEFLAGLKKINRSFDHYFAFMFGGGSASLVVRESNKKFDHGKDQKESLVEGGIEDSEERVSDGGIDISINVPKKKIRGLDMLSGGERALTSIALLFAMSEVNPPPFMVLDETDAALDEANSQKYGDMISSLSKRSQLILISHNRETMSRAGVLYGVTMGSDGVSRLLSVKFDEAEKYAK